MLPSVTTLAATARQITGYTVALGVVTVGFTWVAGMGPLYFAVAAVLSVAFVVFAVQLQSDPSPQRAMRLFGFSITYLAAVFIAMAADTVIF
jgi:protoheme IX farnesyltransferase